MPSARPPRPSDAARPSRRTAPGLLGAVLAGAVLVAASGAPAVARGETYDVGVPERAQARSDNYEVDGDVTVTIDGHGYGHGYGMSQYGAQGAARKGRTFEEIAAFYYPGTTWGSGGGTVRILLTAATDDDVTVRAAGGLRVVRVSDRTAWELPRNDARTWRLKARGTGSEVQFNRGNGWRSWKRVAGEAEFRSSGGPITLVRPGGTARYRGGLRLSRPTSGAGRDTVNVLTMQNYLRGVVPLEIPALWHTEAVSAQAVAARTYAARERFDNKTRNYDLCDTTMCQVYGGVSAEHTASDAAVRRTKGKALWHGGKPAFTQFSASNGGYAAQGSAPYLKARKDSFDPWNGNPYRNWSVKVTDRKIEQTWPQVGDLRRIVVTQRDGKGDWGGRVLSLDLVGSKGRTEVSGSTFRSALGLRSNYLTFFVAPR